MSHFALAPASQPPPFPFIPTHIPIPTAKKFCPIGRCMGDSFLLSGAVIPVWPLLQDVINGHKSESAKFIQVRTPTLPPPASNNNM